MTHIEEKYALVDQMRRASLSVVLQIAEGSNRNTDKDRNLFLARALASLDEVVASLDCARDDGYIQTREYEDFMIKAESIAKQLRGFGKHLSKKS